MTRKTPFLVLSALILLAAVLYTVFATGTGSSAVTPVGDRDSGELQELQPGETMVSQADLEDPFAEPAVPMERQPVDDPVGATSLVKVQGRLVFEGGRPASGQDLVLRRVRQVSEFDFTAIDFRPGQGRGGEETTSDGAGRFSYLVEPGQAGNINLDEEDWVLPDGAVSFGGSRSDIDLGDVEVIPAGLLAGVVVDPTGKPVAGVRVGAGRGTGLAMGFGRFGGRNSATTDDEGRFRITRLRPGNYHLRTASAAFLPQDREVSLGAGERREDLVFELEAGQAVAGQVVDDLGRPVEGINVAARRRTTPTSGVTMERFTPAEATVTDQYGLFTLAGLDADSAAIRAWGPGYADATETGVAIGTSNLVLQVQRLAVIAGVLVDETGAPISGSRVRASVGRGGDMFSMVMRESGPSAAAVATTAEDGSFRIENVRPGSVTVRASGDGHRPVEQMGIAVGPGETTEHLRLIATRGAAVIVRVVDSEGRPVVDAQVQVVEPPERPQGFQTGRSGGRFAIRRDVRIEERGGERIVIDSGAERVLGRGRTDAEGVVVIGGLRAGDALVKATHGELIPARPMEVSLPVTGTVETSLTMAPGGFADLEIRDPLGAPLARARYLVLGPAGPTGPGEEKTGRVDNLGRARVGPLAPGTYAASLQLQPLGRSVGQGVFVALGSSRTLEETRIEFTVRSGEDTLVELVKPVLTAFVGTVFDASGPVVGATIQLEREAEGGRSGRRGGMGRMMIGGGGTFQATSGSDGSFAVEDLSPGTYTVKYGRPNQLVKAETEVRFLPGQAEFRKDLRISGGTLRVTVMSADLGGPLEGARVEVVRPQAEGQSERRIFMVALDVGMGGETMTMEMGGSHVVTDADGLAVIETVPPGKYSLRITHKNHVEQVLTDQTVSDGAVTDAGVAALVLGGDVRGRVRQADGSEVRFAMVEYRRADGDETNQVTAARGSFHLEGLKPGKYLIRARDMLSALGGSPDWGPDHEVEVVAGETSSAEIALSRR